MSDVFELSRLHGIWCAVAKLRAFSLSQNIMCFESLQSYVLLGSRFCNVFCIHWFFARVNSTHLFSVVQVPFGICIVR